MIGCVSKLPETKNKLFTRTIVCVSILAGMATKNGRQADKEKPGPGRPHKVARAIVSPLSHASVDSVSSALF